MSKATLFLAVVFFLTPTANAQPLLFDGFGLLAAVPEAQILLDNGCEYCTTETFAGVPNEQRYTGSGGLAEIYYALPEGGQGVPPLSQPEIYADNSLFVVSQVGDFTGWTHLDFDPPTLNFAASSSGDRHAVVAVCADDSLVSVSAQNERFSLSCAPPGIQRVRFATLGGNSEAIWETIVVPEPSYGALQVCALVMTLFLSRRVRRT